MSPLHFELIFPIQPKSDGYKILLQHNLYNKGELYECLCFKINCNNNYVV